MGVVWWTDGPRRRRGWAVAAFVLAVLSREWLIIVPATVALHDLTVGRRRFREELPLLAAPLALGGWLLWLHHHIGDWPTQASSSERLAVPFAGWIRALSHLNPPLAISYLLAIVLLVISLGRDRRSVLAWVAVAFACSTVVLGENVLSTESYRPLLALFVFGLIASLPAERVARERRLERAETSGDLPRSLA